MKFYPEYLLHRSPMSLNQTPLRSATSAQQFPWTSFSAPLVFNDASYVVGIHSIENIA